MTAAIGLAVVGAGYWGPNLVRNAMATPSFRLRWLCDLDEERARTVLGPYSTVSTTGSFDAILDDDEVQAVAIATPAASHFPLAMAALRRRQTRPGRETLDLRLSRTGRSWCRRPKTVVWSSCATTRTATPRPFRSSAVCTAAHSDEIQFVDSVRINLGLVQPDIDVLWDLAPHDISILDYLLPDGVSVVARCCSRGGPDRAGMACVGVPDVATLDRCHGACPRQLAQPPGQDPHDGHRGLLHRTVVWDDMNPEPAALGLRQRRRAMASDELRPMTGSSGDLHRTGDMVAPVLPWQEALRSMFAEFAASISEGRSAATDGWGGAACHARARGGSAQPEALDGAFVSLGDIE